MGKIKRFLTDGNYRLACLAGRGLLNFMSDSRFLQYKYRVVFGKELNLDNPQTFNEKIQWLKIHNRKPEYTTMVDKYEVKKYVSQIIGDQYVIPTLGVWDKFEDIDFQSLPNQFVLKCTHDSGGIVICRDKEQLDYDEARKKITKSLNSNYYWFGREWPYKNVVPRIIAEPFLSDDSGNDLRDYKFFCFNGKVVYCQVISNRRTKESMDFFDIDWNHQNIARLDLLGRPFPYSEETIPCPVCYDEMQYLAEKLAGVNPFMRIDFYVIQDRPFLGEITFYPASGFGKFVPEKWDKILGDMIDLNSVRTQ